MNFLNKGVSLTEAPFVLEKKHICTMQGQEAYNNYRVEVPAAYTELFTHFYYAQNTSGAPITKTLLPSFQTILVFSFAAPVFLLTSGNDEITINQCMVLGPIKQAFTYTLDAGAEILVANFKDDAFFRFFGTAAAAQQMHPDELLNESCFTRLWNELSAIKTVNDKVQQVLEFSKPYIRPRHPLTEQIVAAKGYNISVVKEVSDKEQISERTVQMNLKKSMGYSSREIGRYLRFLKAIELVQQVACEARQMDWFEVIEQCGYYDQSQLIHDFKHFLHITPSQYLKFQQGICHSRG